MSTRQPKKNTSVFAIIINTNSPTITTEQINEVVTSWYESDSEKYINYLDDRKGPEHIDTMNLICLTGIGDTKKCSYAKLIVTFTHRAKIRFDQAKLKRFFRGKFGPQLQLWTKYYGDIEVTKEALRSLDVETLTE